jgi:hypothetical protein
MPLAASRLVGRCLCPRLRYTQLWCCDSVELFMLVRLVTLRNCFTSGAEIASREDAMRVEGLQQMYLHPRYRAITWQPMRMDSEQRPMKIEQLSVER